MLDVISIFRELRDSDKAETHVSEAGNLVCVLKSRGDFALNLVIVKGGPIDTVLNPPKVEKASTPMQAMANPAIDINAIVAAAVAQALAGLQQSPQHPSPIARTMIPGSAVSALPSQSGGSYSVHADGITATLFGPEGASKRAYKSSRGWVQVGAGKPPTWYQRGLIELNQAT